MHDPTEIEKLKWVYKSVDDIDWELEHVSTKGLYGSMRNTASGFSNGPTIGLIHWFFF